MNDAVAKGAKVLTGGKRREGTGRFFEPTVLVDVDHSMKIMTEETFGPTLPIMRVRDEDEAVEKANDSRYGLNSSVFTKDIEKGERIARRIEAGSTCVNDCITNYTAQELPFGGVKESGIGVRHSEAGIQKYCNPHSILITRFAGKREPYYFPYSKTATKLLERVMVLMYGRGSKKRSLAARRSSRTGGHALVGRVRLPRRADDPADGRARGHLRFADGRACGDRDNGGDRGRVGSRRRFRPVRGARGPGRRLRALRLLPRARRREDERRSADLVDGGARARGGRDRDGRPPECGAGDGSGPGDRRHRARVT